MHKESMAIMGEFFKTLDKDADLSILDVGSLTLGGGTYRRLIESKQWKYVGLDVVAGGNVDVVATDPYRYPFPDNSFDIVISGQTLEHVARIWDWAREICRVTKDGGRVCIIAPSRGHRHHRPDCWRVQPDGMRALLEHAGFKKFEADIKMDGIWQDCVGVAIK